MSEVYSKPILLILDKREHFDELHKYLSDNNVETIVGKPAKDQKAFAIKFVPQDKEIIKGVNDIIDRWTPEEYER